MLTHELMIKIAPRSKAEIIDGIIANSMYIEDGKINTFLRLAHFLGQAAHESDSFRTLEEYASGSAYEGRQDLGNVNPGDGVRYKGRGMFQLTGRNNYKHYGNIIGYDLENNPALASTAKISVLTATTYWNQLNLSSYADKDDIMTITRKINGGLNGLDSRVAYVQSAKVAIAEYCPVQTMLVAKEGDRSPFVKWIQEKLNSKGYRVGNADGIYGAKTAAAVIAFQTAKQINTTGIITLETLKKLRE